MDIRQICEELSDRWPEWSERISMLQFREADGLGAVANDGRSVIYNERLMNYYTREHQCFYIAQQILHLQLNHFARGRGRDPLLWKRASDAVVNALLKADGLSVPEDAAFFADAAEQSAEAIYEVLLENAEQNKESEQLIVREVVLPQSESKQAGKETDAQTRQIDDPGLAAVVAGLAELLEPSMQMDFDWFPGMTIRDGVLGHEFRPYPVAHAEILLDTSASVDAALLRAFVRGVKGLMRQAALIPAFTAFMTSTPMKTSKTSSSAEREAPISMLPSKHSAATRKTASSLPTALPKCPSDAVTRFGSFTETP